MREKVYVLTYLGRQPVHAGCIVRPTAGVRIYEQQISVGQ